MKKREEWERTLAGKGRSEEGWAQGVGSGDHWQGRAGVRGTGESVISLNLLSERRGSLSSARDTHLYFPVAPEELQERILTVLTAKKSYAMLI